MDQLQQLQTGAELQQLQLYQPEPLKMTEQQIIISHLPQETLSFQTLGLPVQELHGPQSMHVLQNQNIHFHMMQELNPNMSMAEGMSNSFKHQIVLQRAQLYNQEFQHVMGKPESLPPPLETVESLKPKPASTTKAQGKMMEPEVILQEKKRSLFPNPSKWACNVRKHKHQRGEAYVSRRGKFVAEKKVRNIKDCLQTCKLKCNTLIPDSEREQIFKAFYSLNPNEKKYFLLNTTERLHIKNPKKSPVELKRKYSFKYFFTIRSEKFTVCKNFYLGTLAISQKPIYNVHKDKSDLNIPKPDGRGTSESSCHKLPPEVKQRVRDHIKSFKAIDGKEIKPMGHKKQTIAGAISIKFMYKLYQDDCRSNNVTCVKESMYRKIFKSEFNLVFKKIKIENQLCSKCKDPVKKK